MRIVPIFLGLMAFSLVSGESVYRLCGQAINEFVSVICNGVTKNLPVKKFDAQIFNLKQPNEIYLSLFDYKTINALTKTRRRRCENVGIYDECCRNKGCTMKELMAYCGGNNK